MDNIATRPAPLTPAERDQVAAHPVTGHAMLSGSGDASFELAAVIALSHHERFAGGGYPHGLSGDAIPVEGRILAVADAFDALTTDRVYRLAGSVEHAVETLNAERGRQFDPHVVDAFLDGLDDAIDVLARHTPECGAAPRDETFLSLQAAADTLRISPSRLRRWSDDGRIETLRTPGGHRRFPLEAVRRLGDEIGVQPLVRPVDPPQGPVRVLADAVRAHGEAIVAAAAASLYRDGPSGWFGSPASSEPLESWMATLVDCCERGRYVAGGAATEVLMREAHLHAATLLERHLFLQGFGQLALRLVLRAEPERAELRRARLLLRSLEQRVLDAFPTNATMLVPRQ